MKDITDSIPDFNKIYSSLKRKDRGFIVKIGDFYCLKADDVAKDGGAMGVGDAGATNAIYGKRPQSLIPTGDKKFGRKRKAKKELYDDRNIHGPRPSKL